MKTHYPMLGVIALLVLLCSLAAMAADVPGNFPQASLRALSYEELAQYSGTDLALMRNEIFARKGYDFATTKYGSYFNNQPWYKPVKGLDGASVLPMLTTAEKANIYQIKFVEGQRLYHAGKHASAYPLLLDAADHGVIAAQNYVGIMHENGTGGVTKSSGIEWYNKAAKQGDPWALNRLGEIYLKDGINFSQNDRRETKEVIAASIFAIAAEKGYEPAAENYRSVLQSNPGIESRVTAYTSYIVGDTQRERINNSLAATSPPIFGEPSASASNWGQTALKAGAAAFATWALYKAAQAAAASISESDNDENDYSMHCPDGSYPPCRRDSEPAPADPPTPVTPVGGNSGLYGDCHHVGC